MSSKRPLYPAAGSHFIVRVLSGLGPFSDDTDATLAALGIDSWDDVRGRFDMQPPLPVFTSVSNDQINKLVAKAHQLDPDYKAPDFASYLKIEPDPNAEISRQLRQLEAGMAP